MDQEELIAEVEARGDAFEIDPRDYHWVETLYPVKRLLKRGTRLRRGEAFGTSRKDWREWLRIELENAEADQGPSGV